MNYFTILGKPQYWTPWIFYIPLYFYFAWLLIRHRGWTFLYCNPCIPYGGIIDDSKSEIYEMLHRSESLLATLKISHEITLDERIEKLDSFMRRNSLNYPVVLKPDRGFRGKGVKVICSTGQAREYFLLADFEVIVQEFCCFEHEMGLFFYRYPWQEKCRIFSIINKSAPSIRGDGSSRVRDIVASHPHLKFASEKLFKDRSIDWDLIPAEGEKVIVCNVFKQGFGAISRNGENLITDGLLHWLDLNTRDLVEFNLGRFDIRYKSESDLKQGKNLKIVELNGAAAESVSLEKFKNPVIDKYYTIFKTWDLVFKVGASFYKQRPNLKVSNWGFLSNALKFSSFKNKLTNVDPV